MKSALEIPKIMLLPYPALREFSGDGLLYRAYSHAIAAKHGSLLLVPLALVAGRIDSLIDGCPVPWEEVITVLEAPAAEQLSVSEIKQGWDFIELVQGTHQLVIERIALRPEARPNVIRFSHASGIRYAIIDDVNLE